MVFNDWMYPMMDGKEKLDKTGAFVGLKKGILNVSL